ncbi:phage tail sheath subtilisin-like domain-containing protein [Phormidium sp. CLA17]|uniref:phage tail sheath subtilisin-like domain-containing protein n=1 Tax=Leptolyngbya sp. Cla-17 TaxID=2803751 RepID=UPI0014924124|nr:phage tail sheath subtilisin-like domain-containing protein [Leptolyngbya sp. Cla-17]MBM0740392.1 phage tail sheath subtilisin-like domain-containing protein [Leptolyngbya sp. Cla-17]
MPPTRLFPGIAFRAETPTVVDLPRMDIAAFVGFAQRGPLDVPVVVESYADFADVFGGLYRLAWDGETGSWQTACLAPAIRAFFAQGGRRCWVVRVASREQAIANQFPLAGLLQTNRSDYTPVIAKARSVGSWSDNLQVRVELQLDRIAFAAATIQPGAAFSLSLPLIRNQELQIGDLLQLDFSDQRHQAYVVIGQTDFQVDGGTTQIKGHAANTYWFCTVQQVTSGFVETNRSALSGPISAPISMPVLAQLTPEGGWVLTKNFSPLIKFWLYLLSEGVSVHALVVWLAIAFQPDEPGDWLQLNTSDGSRIWLLVKDVEARRVNLQGAWIEGWSTTESLTITRIQRLQIALNVSGESAADYTLQNLACAASHPRFLGNLPDDDRLFAAHVGLPQPLQSASIQSSIQSLWQEVKSPRFPLALDLVQDITIIPLGLSVELPSRGAVSPDAMPLVRDGLVPTTDDEQGLSGADWSSFWPEIFLDQTLRLTGQRSLMAEASDRLYLQAQPLRGIHALFPIEEISLIALPDAAHRGWRLTPSAAPTLPAASVSASTPDPSTISLFTPCVTPASGETKTRPSSPTEAEATQWQLLLPQEYEATGLLDVQQAVARLAAARGDLVAVLGVPKHYRLPETLTHQQRLLTRVHRDGDTTDSYIALYHPWLVSRAETGELLHTHPAGSMAGVMAARSLSRGAWIAPANEVLQDVLATLPVLNLGDEQTLYGSGINPIRQTARGFVAWGSYTQSLDPDLENLHIRRLLILLRRLALREGQTYVFAPHSAAFRRRIQQQFEQVLARLFDRGAFAGRVPTEAYQVGIDGILNRQNTIEQGQLIVELRVAPSQPMTFITVRLVQIESNVLTVQEVRPNGR